MKPLSEMTSIEIEAELHRHDAELHRMAEKRKIDKRNAENAARLFAIRYPDKAKAIETAKDQAKDQANAVKDQANAVVVSFYWSCGLLILTALFLVIFTPVGVFLAIPTILTIVYCACMVVCTVFSSIGASSLPQFTSWLDVISQPKR